MASFLISLAALEKNARVLSEVAEASGGKVVLALKAFALPAAFPTLKPHLAGCCASGLWEAKLSHQYFGKETLTYSPAYNETDLPELLSISSHLDFNSWNQWNRFRETCLQSNDAPHFGLRINPGHSTTTTELYDPCSPQSRLGVRAEQLVGKNLEGLSTLHFHTLCEQPLKDLLDTIEAVERDFSPWLKSEQFTQLNLGGGHWITKPNYERQGLIELIERLQETYQVQVWLEPGEAVAIHTGVLRTTVLDTFESSGKQHAILDISATCHTPDVLEMPYQPDIFLVEPGTASPNTPQPAVTLPGETYLKGRYGEQQGTFLGGLSCLAGDTFGRYQFPRELKVGDTLVLDDMSHYSFVKSSFFNGVPHPNIELLHPDQTIERVKSFTSKDFSIRLGGSQ